MKIILFLLLAFVIQVNAKAYSQQRVSLEYENVELSKVMKSLERQTNLYFFFNDKALDTKQRVSVSVENEDLESVLQRLFGDVYDWEIVNNMIVLKPNVNQASGTQQQQLKERKVNGIVKDRRGEPLPGVAVVLKGTTVGTATDIDGKYTLTLPEGNYTLVFSMLGMKVREELVGDRTEIDVVMEEDAAEMDEVVVTGIFKKARESYTGAVSTITREELQVHRGQNLLQTLKNVDVSLNFRANNAVGSNPNARPQINIRGNSSLPNLDALNEEASNTVNEPLVIMDGFEISLDRLMDYNDEEIESINILKDAAATAIYGSRGSNGVIVITTREPEPGKLRINAEVGIDLEVPDLTSYDLLNAKEKLELEYSLGLYNNTSNPEYDVAYKDLYNQRYRNV
ncbi:MAG TPA: carboxypeptidase-like regulatory domain-containing protein, partial [Candidatus Odoribacter faecigallinarum]|nr:carboxypeptidase-like regulatory domain-containing protein [Candidatus Odoribacter faecigallinarum]